MEWKLIRLTLLLMIILFLVNVWGRTTTSKQSTKKKKEPAQGEENVDDENNDVEGGEENISGFEDQNDGAYNGSEYNISTDNHGKSSGKEVKFVGRRDAFTFIPVRVSWNKADDVCRVHGRRLAELDITNAGAAHYLMATESMDSPAAWIASFGKCKGNEGTIFNIYPNGGFGPSLPHSMENHGVLCE